MYAYVSCVCYDSHRIVCRIVLEYIRISALKYTRSSCTHRALVLLPVESYATDFAGRKCLSQIFRDLGTPSAASVACLFLLIKSLAPSLLSPFLPITISVISGECVMVFDTVLMAFLKWCCAMIILSIVFFGLDVVPCCCTVPYVVRFCSMHTVSTWVQYIITSLL